MSGSTRLRMYSRSECYRRSFQYVEGLVRCSSIISVSLVLCLALSGEHVAADIIPPDLPVGSQYQLIFVTAHHIAATSSDIDFYNEFVAAEAALNPSLPVASWHAVISTGTVDANLNAPSYALPVYDTAGRLVAPASTGLYTNSFVNSVGGSQFGFVGTGISENVWTGSVLPGVAATRSLGEWELSPNQVFWLGPQFGFSGATDSEWLTYHQDYVAVNVPGWGQGRLPLYALSSPITVPEPATSMLLLFGSLVIAMYRARKSTLVN